MGLLDRLEKAVTGFGGAMLAPAGFALDIARTPFDDDEEYAASIGALGGHFKRRGAQVLEGIWGDDQGLGALGIAGPVKAGLSNTLEGMETAYREGVAEPISTALFVDRQAGWTKLDEWFEGENWREGYRRAQFTSPGRAEVISLRSYFQDERNAETATPELLEESFGRWENLASGTFDVMSRLYLDPTFVGAKATMAVRAARRPLIDSAETLERVAGARQFARFNDALEGKSAAEIRDRFFSQTPNGGALSVALAEAGDAATRASVLRLAMGDRKQFETLYRTRADIAGQIERLTGTQNILRSLDPDNFARVNSPEAQAAAREIAEATPPRQVIDLTALDNVVPPGSTVVDEFPGQPLDEISSKPELARIQAEINTLVDREEMLRRNESFMGAITQAPVARRTDAARSAITRTDFYQNSLAATPLRVAFTMRPPRYIDLNDPSGDIGIWRQLQHSTLDRDAQHALRTEYMAATTPEARAAAVVRIEETAVAKLAEDAGMTADEIQAVMARAANGRGVARDVLKGRVYDGEGRSRLSYYDDGQMVQHEVPLLVTETADVLPIADIDAARKALTLIGDYKRRMGRAATIPPDLLEKFYRVWKPSVLLRVGWPIRVVGDEQLRIMGKIGVLAQLRNLGPGIANMTGNRLERAAAGLGEDKVTRLAARENAPQSGIGFGEIEVGGYRLEGAFGADKRAPNAFYELSSSRPTFDAMLGSAEKAEVEKWRMKASNWTSIHPVKDAEKYAPVWLHAVNNLLGRDELARVFLSGGSVEDGVRFLNSTEGRVYKSRLTERARQDSPEHWATAVKEQVDSYTLGSATIMQAAIKQRATVDDLFKVAPDPAMRPIVHGGMLEAAGRRGPAWEFITSTVQKAYNALGSVPSDTLSRHPFFDAMYRAEAGRLVGLLDSQGAATSTRLNATELDLIQRKSREYALQQTKKLLYNLGDESDLSHTLRFLSPFYSAWQETMTTWAGIAVSNPAYIVRLHQAWASPERAGLITDEYGNEIGPGDRRGDTKTYDDGSVSTIGRDRYLTLPVPRELLSGLGLKGVREGQTVRFNKKSFNLMLQGAPGFGAPIQIPVNEIVKERPDLAESMRFILPFGAQQSSLGSLFPATAKRVSSRVAGEDDRVFRNAWLRIYMDSVVDYKLGKRDTPPTGAEAMKKAKDFFNLRAVASFVLPAAPGFQSPYQLQLDSLRRFRAMDPVNGDAKWLEQHGEEYWALTQSFTKSADGVPPTVEAFKARGKYSDLIEKHPELGSVIIGQEGAGEFNNSVYQSQLENQVAPGSIENQRNSLGFEAVDAGPDVRMGWLEYQKLNDTIEAERINRGLPNLRVKGAQDLAAIKRAGTATLAEKYPEWFNQFSITDRNAMGKKLEGLRAMAAHPKMQDRQDIQGLKVYLELREVFRQILAVREQTVGTGSLDSARNQDVATVWETITGALAEKNLAWSALFFRHLDRDNLEAA